MSDADPPNEVDDVKGPGDRDVVAPDVDAGEEEEVCAATACEDGGLREEGEEW